MDGRRNNKGKIGNKGGGRGTAREEFQRNRVIGKAWDKKDEKMSDAEATQIVLKDMTVKTDITSDGNELAPVLVKFISEKE